MKSTQLLNRHLSTLVASIGHLDEILIVDAGFPIPASIPVIDLAVSPGVPRFFDVLHAIRTELAIEAAVYAEEANKNLQDSMREEIDTWARETKKEIERVCISHHALKKRASLAKGIVRTGEVTPYANLILVAGVVF